MPPTLREVKESLAERAASERIARNTPTQQAFLAAVSAEKLLGDPNWDRYIMRLQALINEVTAARAIWAERCTGAISADNIRVAQFNFHACDARLTTLLEVMAIPKSLIEEVYGASPSPNGSEPTGNPEPPG